MYTPIKPVRQLGRAGAFLLAGAFALSAHASPPPNIGAPPSRLSPEAQARTPTSLPDRATRHVQHDKLTPAERPPQPASRAHLHEDYDRPSRMRSSPLRALSQSGTCDPATFAAASGSTLTAAVQGASLECLNTLYSITGPQAGNIFPQSKMVTIANALGSNAGNYAGDNSDGILQLITFLRAGYYVQFYDSDDVGDYGAPLQDAIRPALDAFVANPHFTDVNDQHGQVLAEFVTLIDSSGENAHQLETVKNLLNQYDSSYHSYFYMMSAVNNVFTVLFRGHQNADFQAAVKADPSITIALSDFISNHAAEAGTDNEYLLANAAREMARFLQYSDLESTVKTEVKSVLDRYDMTGDGASVWVATADMADYYDHDNCSYYGICDYRSQLEQAVLPIQYECSPHLVLRAQALTADQITQTCDEVMGETSYFHQLVQDNQTPVDDDLNTSLELVIFHSSADYSTYSGAIFGNSTDNGGIYLEGNPADPDNQARFIAYEAEWLRPDFDIWNLTHEYVHYLDGRFDMYGDFNDYTAVPAIWWMEGLAEFVSYSYRDMAYPEATAAAGTQQFTLGNIFDNTYNSGEERVYRWGYLAVRYMFEKQRPEVTTILGDFRPGNYTAYTSFLASIHSAHDNDWNEWLTCLNTHQGDTTSCGGSTTPPPTDPPTDPPSDFPECTNSDARVITTDCQRSGLQSTSAGDIQYFYIAVPANASPFDIVTQGGSGNADLYVSASGWPTPNDYEQMSAHSGNDESVTITPSASGGYYYIALYTTTPYADVAIHASASGGNGGNTPPSGQLPECTGPDGTLDDGCRRSGQSVMQAGDADYLTLWVPQGTSRLHIETRGGTGDADLYVRGGNWPTTSHYDANSTQDGNVESVDINQPGNGYYYILLQANTPFSDVSVSASMN